MKTILKKHICKVTGFNISMQKKTVFYHIPMKLLLQYRQKESLNKSKGGTYQKYGLSQILKPK
jgi:hypothetical protein